PSYLPARVAADEGPQDARAEPVAFTQSWESFPLSIPVTEELLSAGELCARYLYAVLRLYIHRTSANANPPRRAGGQHPGRGRWRTLARTHRLAADHSSPAGPRPGRLHRRPPGHI